MNEFPIKMALQCKPEYVKIGLWCDKIIARFPDHNPAPASDRHNVCKTSAIVKKIIISTYFMDR